MPLSGKKNFTIILDPANDFDQYYLEYSDKLKKILMEGLTERVLFNAKNLQQAKAFILFRVVMGITLIEDVLNLCPDKEAQRTVSLALRLLFAAGLLRTKYHSKAIHNRELVIANEQRVWSFIRKHKIRAIDAKWDIVTTAQTGGKEQLIGTIDEWRIIRRALPGNVLYLGSKGLLYRVVNVSDRKIRVELLSATITNVQKNKLKPPLFLIAPHARVQQLGPQRVLFGKLIVRWETAAIARYDRTGKLIEQELPTSSSTEEQKASKNYSEDAFAFIPKYTWDQKTSGLLFSLDLSAAGNLSYKAKTSVLTFFKRLLLKATELALHISETSFSCLINRHENQIVLFERGGSMGNSECLFSKLPYVLKQMVQLTAQLREGENSAQGAPSPFLYETPPETIQAVQKILQEMIDACP